MPEKLVAKSLTPDNAALIAERLRKGRVAGVLVSDAISIQRDERFVLVEDRNGAGQFAHGLVTLSDGVPFADPSQLTSLADKVGEQSVKKARDDGEPVTFHSVYAVEMFPEARPLKGDDGVKKALVRDIVTPDAEYLGKRLADGETAGILSTDADLHIDAPPDGPITWDPSVCLAYPTPEKDWPTESVASVHLPTVPLRLSSGKAAVESLGDAIGPKQRAEFATVDGSVYFYELMLKWYHGDREEKYPKNGASPFLRPATEEDIAKAVWSAAYINDLPDTAFLLIESGGEKDEDGKTKPRSLRHLPVYDADGALDEPHLRAALSRLNQTKTADGKTLPAATQRKIRDKARRLLDSLKKSALPKVLTKSAVADGWMPDEGSGLPASLEATVPESLRYWDMPEEVRKDVRDLLVDTGWLNSDNVVEYQGELVRTVNVTKRHVYLGNGSDFDPLDMLAKSEVDSDKALETSNGESEDAHALSNAHNPTDRTSEPVSVDAAHSDGSEWITKAEADKEWGYVLGEVLFANDGKDGNPVAPDAHNDVLSEDQLQKTAHEYAADFRQLGIMHKGKPVGPSVARFADSLVLPKGWSLKTEKGYTMDKPTWLLGAYVKRSSQMWKDIESGKLNAWSIDGRGQRVPEQVK